MTFDDILEQVIQLLQHQGRVFYRGLKRRFALNDDYLEDLKEELIHAQRVAADEDGRILVWIGDARTTWCLPHALQQIALDSAPGVAYARRAGRRGASPCQKPLARCAAGLNGNTQAVGYRHAGVGPGRMEGKDGL